MVRGKIIKQKVIAEKAGKTAKDAGSEVETKERLGCFGFYSEGDENCQGCSDKEDCIANPAIATDEESDDFDSKEEPIVEEREDSKSKSEPEEEEEVTEITFDDIAAMSSEDRVAVMSDLELDDLQAIIEYFELSVKAVNEADIIVEIDKALSSKGKDESVEDDQVDDTEELTVNQLVNKLQGMPTQDIEGYLGEMETQELKEMAESLELEIPGVRATKPKLISVMMDYLESLGDQPEPEAIEETEVEEETDKDIPEATEPVNETEVEEETPVDADKVVEEAKERDISTVETETVEPMFIEDHKTEMPFGMPTVTDMGSAMFSTLRASLILAIPYVSVTQVKELADYLAAKVEELS